MLLIGSAAAQKYYDFWRTAKDIDVVVPANTARHILNLKNEDELPLFFAHGITEYFVARPGEPLVDLLDMEGANDDKIHYASPTALLAIKNAHKHFYMGKYKKSFKHLIDYSTLRNLDPHLPEKYRDFSFAWRKTLLKEYDDIRLTKLPSLEKTKEQFFNDKVTYYYDHDSIHEIVAYLDVPMYTKCMKDGKQVQQSKDKFFNLPESFQMYQVLEESYVIALERCLIPIMHGNMNVPAISPTEALKYALTRVATNLTGGWFRKFAADNFSEIYGMHKPNYYQTFLENMDKLRPHEQV